MSGTPASGGRVWTEEGIRALGASTDLVTAAEILGIGRTTAHTLVRAGEFPVPVIRVGRRYRVPVAPILRLLGLHTNSPATAEDLPDTHTPTPHPSTPRTSTPRTSTPPSDPAASSQTAPQAGAGADTESRPRRRPASVIDIRHQ